jgi:hypothetical protein
VAVSTVPALKSALLGVLQARAGLSGVQVTYGWPAAPQREFIVLYSVSGRQSFAALGHLSREESYELQVVISVLSQGGVQQTITERAFALMAEIENALRADPTVGGVVRTAELGPDYELSERDNGDVNNAAIVTHVHCTARI